MTQHPAASPHTAHPGHSSDDITLMPPLQPMEMPEQDFAAPFRDANAPAPTAAPQMAQVALWRFLAFSPAMLATAALTWVMQGWFAKSGFMLLELMLLALIAFNFFWI